MNRGRVLRGAVVAGVAAASFLYGFLAARQHLPPAGLLVRATSGTPLASLFRRDRRARPAEALPGVPVAGAGNAGSVAAPGGGPGADDFERLRSIGYLGAEEDAPAASGVVVHDPDRADGSRLLWTSGHAGFAALMERDGTVLHTWQLAFADAFPDVVIPETHDPFDYFRKVWLFDDGSLLVIFEGEALVKMDRDSRILWAKRNHAHHDLHVAPSGEILVLTRDVHVEPDWNPRRPILEGFITVLDPDGEEIRRISLLDAVERSAFAGILDYSPEWGDLMHTNTLELVPDAVAGQSPSIPAGSALVSFNATNVLGVIDLAEERMTWAIAGLTNGNHDAKFLENGNLLVFDNAGGANGHSRVLEVDPFTLEIVWSYDGDDANGFSSWCCGIADRLSNGNTLITESAAGRAFEVTRENEIVWEFLNPRRDGDDPGLIAYIMDMQPIPGDQPLEWLSAQ